MNKMDSYRSQMDTVISYLSPSNNTESSSLSVVCTVKKIHTAYYTPTLFEGQHTQVGFELQIIKHY